MLTAMAHDKHVYGQKPLVHQLAEIRMMEMAVAAKPHLVTQLGNQRMAKAGRRAAVDNCLGKKTELRTPFADAIRITEPALLAVKATRFPGETLLWDKQKLVFTNSQKATDTIVRRDYRQGFAPPRVG